MRNAAVWELTCACCIKRLWPPSQKAEPTHPEPAPPAAHLNVALLSSLEGSAGPGAVILPPAPEPSQSEPKVPSKSPGRRFGRRYTLNALGAFLLSAFLACALHLNHLCPCSCVCFSVNSSVWGFLKACTLLHDSHAWPPCYCLWFKQQCLKRCEFIYFYLVINLTRFFLFIFSPRVMIWFLIFFLKGSFQRFLVQILRY